MNKRANWSVGDIIRHKLTGHPYKVIHIYKNASTILVDLNDPSPLPPTLSLLPRNYDEYSRDINFRFMKETGKWVHYIQAL